MQGEREPARERAIDRALTAVFLGLLLVFLAAAPAAAADGSDPGAPAAETTRASQAPQPPQPDLSLESIVDEANRERDEALQARERNVAEAEARVDRMRADLEALIARNEALRKDLEARSQVVDQANAEGVKRLIKVYESMEPESAAPILDGVSEKVALTVLSGMKGRAAAGIMGLLPAEKAARLSERLAHPR